jgi:hypothetical protein
LPRCNKGRLQGSFIGHFSRKFRLAQESLDATDLLFGFGSAQKFGTCCVFPSCARRKSLQKLRLKQYRRAPEVGAMAENDAQPAGHPAMDYEAHEKTYRMFLQLIKFAMGGVAAILVLLAFLWG